MNNLNNTVQLIGRLGADPEVRTLKGDRRYEIGRAHV